MRRFVIVALAGFFSVGAISACASSHHESEDNEVAVVLDDLPGPVHTTLQRESAGGKLTDVEKEVQNGKTVYSADMLVRGVARDITVVENGTVVSREKEKDGEN